MNLRASTVDVANVLQSRYVCTPMLREYVSIRVYPYMEIESFTWIAGLLARDTDD